MIVCDRHALLVTGILRVRLQLEQVQLRGTANRSPDPGGGQHDPRATVDPGDLQGLQDRVVTVQGDADDHVARQINPEDSAEGHYPTHGVPCVPFDGGRQNDLGGDQDEGDKQIRDRQVHQHRVDSRGGAKTLSYQHCEDFYVADEGEDEEDAGKTKKEKKEEGEEYSINFIETLECTLSLFSFLLVTFFGSCYFCFPIYF